MIHPCSHMITYMSTPNPHIRPTDEMEIAIPGRLEGTGASASSDALDQSDCSILAITSPFYPPARYRSVKSLA